MVLAWKYETLLLNWAQIFVSRSMRTMHVIYLEWATERIKWLWILQCRICEGQVTSIRSGNWCVVAINIPTDMPFKISLAESVRREFGKKSSKSQSVSKSLEKKGGFRRKIGARRLKNSLTSFSDFLGSAWDRWRVRGSCILEVSLPTFFCFEVKFNLYHI